MKGTSAVFGAVWGMLTKLLQTTIQVKGSRSNRLISRSKTIGHSGRVMPTLESLEDRWVPDGNVLVFLQGSDVHILGDGLANKITITWISGNTYQAVGWSAAGRPTTVNGKASEAFTMNASLFLDMGAGDDNVLFGNTSSKTTILGDLDFRLKEGGDIGNLTNVTVHGASNILLGPGRSPSTTVESVTVSGSRFMGSVWISQGGAARSAYIALSSVQADSYMRIQVPDHTVAAQITLGNVVAAQNVEIVTGSNTSTSGTSQGSSITLNNVRANAGTVSVTTGLGNDTVQLNNASSYIINNLSVTTDGGNDTVKLFNYLPLNATLNGGAGTDGITFGLPSWFKISNFEKSA